VLHRKAIYNASDCACAGAGAIDKDSVAIFLERLAKDIAAISIRDALKNITLSESKGF
jgi:hypothetical protein